MRRTGYIEEIAKDKLNRGLDKEVGLAWAQTPQKPRSLHEQMALIRDIGHSLENFKTLNKMNHDHHPKSHNNSHDSRGPCLYLHAVGPENFWSACEMLTETGGRGEGFRYVWFPPAAAFGM